MARHTLQARTVAVLLTSTALVSPALAQANPPVAGVEAAWLAPPTRPALEFKPDALPSRAEVMPALNYVAASQIADMSRRPIALSTGSNLTEISSNWVAATFYIGAARLARVSENPEILRFLTAAAEHYNYSLRGARSEKLMLNADEVTIGDL